MDYHVLNSTKRKKSLFINFLPNTQNKFFAISKHNNQVENAIPNTPLQSFF
ncbi:hypothetical protein Hanom_Chr02g00143511 [Helianthus anomalus]